MSGGDQRALAAMPEEISMIDAREAVRSAYDHLIGMLGIQGPDRSPTDIILEEVEVAPDTKSWLVTFSYSIPGESEENPASPLALRQFLKQSPRRKLRVVTIDKEGAFRSLKVPS